jgi:hypothetical protein
VQPHVEGILQVAANGIAALKDAARRYPDAILSECCGHRIDIFMIIRFRKMYLDISKGGVFG